MDVQLGWPDLELVRELGDRGSVTAVAEASHRTPSAVSQQLKSLQRRLGIPLVERDGRGLRLTDAGRALADSATGVATALAEADASWRRFLGDVSGTVRLASFFSASELFIPGLVERLALRFPRVRLDTFDEDVSQDGFADLVADYDIVVAHRSDDTEPAPRPNIRVVPLLREPLDVGLPLGHPLAGRAAVEPADLVGEPWTAPPVGFPIERALLALSARAGQPVRVVRRTTHLPLMERLVSRGQCLALLPRYSTLDHADGRFALVPLTGLRAGRHVEALLRPDREARRVVAAVLEELRAEAAQISAGR
ncbi:LysR family transcriptional regulator [Microlunatus ginsengisoli]|uniref:LysR family transcriptional regulator n=1 Tax=Microlunatus ginsengisoli TaxID=363863 RepID=A0ABP6ZND0_9ACTN